MAHFSRYISGAIAAISLCYSLPLQAQLIPDTSLGTESSLVQFIDAHRQDIHGGALRGTNLFHSFQEFNIGQDKSVYFANPTLVENILTRVTGSNTSEIFGTLGVDGNANLFLLNPNGLYFNKNARLDIAGSFTASTSDRITFGENAWFSLDTTPNQLLNIQPESSFNYALQNYLGDITSEGLLHTGGNLNLQGKNLFLSSQIGAHDNLNLHATEAIQIRDTIENPLQLVSGKNLLVEGLKAVDILALKHPDSGLWSAVNMTLRSANDIGGDAHFFSGGNFKIESLDNNLGNLYSPHDPIIRSYGDVSIGFYEGTSLHVLAGGSVTLGTALIWSPEISEAGGLGIDFLKEKITLSDGSQVTIDGSTRPTLDVRAGILPEYIGNDGITGFLNWYPYEYFADATWTNFENPTLNTLPTSANIVVGDSWINAPDGQIFLTNQYHPNLNLSGNITILPKNGFFSFGIKGDNINVILDSRNNMNISSMYSYIPIIDTNGGGVSLKAMEQVELKNAVVDTSSSLVARHSGDISILAHELFLEDTSLIRTSTYFPEKNAGSITLNVQDSVNITGNENTLSGLNTRTQNTGQGGKIEIKTDNLFLQNAYISTSSHHVGNAGDIHIQALNKISLDYSYLSSSSFLPISGASGEIKVKTSTLNLNGGHISNITASNKDSGEIIIHADQSVLITGSENNSSGILSDTHGTGRAGNIEINTNQLTVQDWSVITTTTSGRGDAGKLLINTSDMFVSGEGKILTSVSEMGKGNGGNLIINTNNLFIDNGFQIASGTFGSGNAGKLIVNASNSVDIHGYQSGLFASAEENTGNANSLIINTKRLNIEEEGLISTITHQYGEGGDINISAVNSITLDHGNIFASAATDSTGKAGAIDIQAKNLSLENQSQISSETKGVGDAGNIQIHTNNLLLNRGSNISSETSNYGNAGNIKLNIFDSLILDGANTGIFVNTNIESTGNGGSINIDPVDIIIRNSAEISASSQGAGIGGNIYLTSDNLFLENNAFVNTSTSSTNGGDIELRINEFLSLKEGSNITATAGLGTAGGDGGNIKIFAPWIVAFPKQDNNIKAEAFDGAGGNISITSNALFGIGFTGKDIPVRNDITASSQFGLTGSVEINTPDVDPASGLNELPRDLIDADSLIGQNSCAVEHDRIAGGSSLVMTGKGGLPSRPNGNVSIHAPMLGYLNNPDTIQQFMSSAAVSPQVNSLDSDEEKTELAIAQGWQRLPDGSVQLVASGYQARQDLVQHPHCVAQEN